MQTIYLLLHESIHSLQDHLDLQKDGDTLVQWLLDHNLTLNVKKCKSLPLSRKNSRSLLNRPSLPAQNCQLEKVQSYEYLGVLITADLTWSCNVASASTKARKRLGLLYRKFYNYAEPKSLMLPS